MKKIVLSCLLVLFFGINNFVLAYETNSFGSLFQGSYSKALNGLLKEQAQSVNINKIEEPKSSNNKEEWAKYYYNIAVQMCINKKEEDAIKNALKSLDYAQNADTYALLAQVYSKQDDLNAALKYINKAIKLNSDNLIFYAIRAKINDKLGFEKAALDDFIKAIPAVEQGEITKYYTNFAQKCLKNDYKGAITDYNKIIVLRKDTKNNLLIANDYGIRAKLKLTTKDYQGAIDDYTQAIKLNPNVADYYAFRAYSYFAIKSADKYSNVISDTTKAIELGMDTFEIYFLRGMAYDLMENYVAASKDLTIALIISTDNKQLLNSTKKYIKIIRQKRKQQKQCRIENKKNNIDYNSYIDDMEICIQKNWDPPKNEYSSSVIVIFTIQRDGKLLSVKVLKSSGIARMDKAAIKAIKKTAPFKPLPKEFKGKKVDIQFTFDYNVFNEHGKVK